MRNIYTVMVKQLMWFFVYVEVSQMKAVWEIRDLETDENVGIITMEGDWRNAEFRKNFILFILKINQDNPLSVFDSSNQSIEKGEE